MNGPAPSPLAFVGAAAAAASAASSPASQSLFSVPSVPGRAEPGCTAPAVGPHRGDQTGGDSRQCPGRSLQPIHFAYSQRGERQRNPSVFSD